MQKEELFKSQKKLRHAEIIRPPNLLKQKVGSGDVPKEAIEKAQDTLNNTTIDFRPIAWALIKELTASVQILRGSLSKDERDIELLLFPAMQLKTQGAMLKYKAISDIADVLVQYLETVPGISADVLTIVDAHLTGFQYLLKTAPEQIKPATVDKLVESLLDACERYYKQYGRLE